VPFAPASAWFIAPTTVRALIDIAQGAPERVNFPFIAQFLALGEFHEFQNFFHLIHCTFERLDHLHHFVNRLADGGTMMRRFGHGDALGGDAFGQALDPLEQWLWCRRRGGGERSFGYGNLGLGRRFRPGGR